MDSTIETDRIVLRHVTHDDLDAIQQCILDPRIYKMVAKIPANQPRKVTDEWISTHADGRSSNTHYPYALTVEGNLVGLMGLHRQQASDLFNLGYWISPDAWGKGYATEAGRALLLNLETTMGAQKTLAGYFSDNLGSGRVLEKLGYIQVGENQIYCSGRDKVLPHIIVERPASQ